MAAPCRDSSAPTSGVASLSYLEGGTGHDVGHWSDGQLVELAGLTRAIHDALAGTPEAGDAETVCHDDLAPWNTILSTDQPDSQHGSSTSGVTTSPAAKHSEIMAAVAWVDHNRRTLITSLLRRR